MHAHAWCAEGIMTGLIQGLKAACHACRHMPDVFRAISPHYAFQYFFSTGEASWVSLNGILLCVSGSEALFADMGHFSHRAISVSAPPENPLHLRELGCVALRCASATAKPFLLTWATSATSTLCECS